jgi:hypothetical protein
MRPLMYGYCRVELLGRPLTECDEMLHDYAESDGYDLGTVFYEHHSSLSAFMMLIDELRRAAARVVLVPSFAHLDGLTQPPHTLVNRLRRDANAVVYAVAQTAIDDSQQISRTVRAGS